MISTWIQRNGQLSERLVQQNSEHGIGMLPRNLLPSETMTSVCGYCSTGCNLRIHRTQHSPVAITPDPTYPVNLGMACPKGWEALNVLNSPDRALDPLLRQSKSGALCRVNWETAIQQFCARFKSIQSKYGAESVAFLSTGQIPTEEMAFLGCLAKFGMGFIHGDANTRQCMATSAVAYKQSFGFDAPPFSYEDLELSETLVFIGANPCIAHPILWQRVLQNRKNPNIVVIDPRTTETAMAATMHLRITPKSDLILLYGIARMLIEMDALDRTFIQNHCIDFELYQKHVQAFSLERVQAATGIDEARLRRVANLIAESSATSFWWTMGVNQSYQGTRTAQAIINLALMTGNIGKPGTGANSITGQCNAMGSRLFSNTTQLIGHHDFANAEHRAKISKVLNIPIERIPSKQSLAYDQILDQIEQGNIKGLWVVATNPAHSWVNNQRAREALKKLEFLAVQDMYQNTETAQMADLILPAAGWGEKEGTFINSERRIGLIQRVAQAPGQALADFYIFRLIAKTWGCERWFQQWTSPQEVFHILKEISRDQPCDITGIPGYAALARSGGIQWPWPDQKSPENSIKPEAPGCERRLFADGKFYHSDGKARFLFDEPASMPEAPDDVYPFLLLTGRGTVAQWHTQSRTSKSSVLRSLYPANPYVEIHPADASELEISSGDWVTIQSRRGQARITAWITSTVQRKQLFMPMHDEQTNQLTNAVVDPYSRQPSYKDCAVAVFKS